MRKQLWALMALALVACGGDSTGPSNTPPNVAGAWRFTWANMDATVDGETIVCTAIMDFNLNQSGATFSGVQTQTLGNMTCTILGEGTVLDEALGGETIINGQLTGQQVSFRLGTVDGTNTGTISGTSMTGNASWVFDLGGGTSVSLTGTWSAAKL